VQLNWNIRLRQTHRWLSIAFILGVIVNTLAVVAGNYALWLGILAGVPLALLAATGLYLFMLPYVARWRGGRHSLGLE
jgi:quinol-cytochrome oxidoreductase complex cytochrome b subunit